MLDLIAVAAAVAVTSLAPGDWVTYMLGDLPRCARAAYVDNGADGRPWAWIVGGNAPQWALHVPVEELTQGCAQKQQEAKR